MPALGDAQLRSLEATVATLAEVGSQLVTIAQDLGAALARVAAPIALGAPVAPPVEVAPARTTTPARTTSVP